MVNFKNIEVVITWRFLFYIVYLMMLWILVSLAIIDHYENRLVMIIVWFMFVVSYPLSVFLIRWREI